MPHGVCFVSPLHQGRLGTVRNQLDFYRFECGRYLSAMVPGMWLAEGGESATGALLDHLVMSHPAGHALKQTSGTLLCKRSGSKLRVLHAMGSHLTRVRFALCGL